MNNTSQVTYMYELGTVKIIVMGYESGSDFLVNTIEKFTSGVVDNDILFPFYPGQKMEPADINYMQDTYGYEVTRCEGSTKETVLPTLLQEIKDGFLLEAVAATVYGQEGDDMTIEVNRTLPDGYDEVPDEYLIDKLITMTPAIPDDATITIDEEVYTSDGIVTSGWWSELVEIERLKVNEDDSASIQALVAGLTEGNYLIKVDQYMAKVS